MNPKPNFTFPILAWGAPPPEETTVPRYREIAAAGFTGVITWFNHIPFHRRLLDIGGSAGLKVWLGDFRLLTPRNAPAGRFLHNLNELIGDHRDHPALGGHYLLNHPRLWDLPHLSDVNRHLRKHDPERRPLINLPSGCPWISRFIRVVRPSVLSWDQLPARSDGERVRYLKNLATMRSISLTSGIPMWPTLYCAGFEKCREPTEAELRWQVWVNLCHGAKGISWIPYWSPGPSRRWHGGGLISADGKRTPRYKMVRRLNRKVQVLGSTLARLRSVGVFHGGTGIRDCRCPIRAIHGKETIIGWFQDARKTDFLLVVDGSTCKPSRPQLVLAPTIRFVAEVSQSTGGLQRRPVAGGTLQTDLPPGTGRLFRL